MPVPVLLLIAGLILLLAGPHWFAGAHTVGLILTIAGGVGIAFILLMVVGMGGFMAWLGLKR